MWLLVVGHLQLQPSITNTILVLMYMYPTGLMSERLRCALYIARHFWRKAMLDQSLNRNNQEERKSLERNKEYSLSLSVQKLQNSRFALFRVLSGLRETIIIAHMNENFANRSLI